MSVCTDVCIGREITSNHTVILLHKPRKNHVSMGWEELQQAELEFVDEGW